MKERKAGNYRKWTVRATGLVLAGGLLLTPLPEMMGAGYGKWYMASEAAGTLSGFQTFNGVT